MERGNSYNIKTGSKDLYRKLGASLTGEEYPVVGVSWNDAVAYAKWLSQQTGGHYRLPTEAEWEYGARAGTTTPFATGQCISTDQANYNGNYPYSGCSKGAYRKATTSVGSFAPNAWGVYDMHGNVWEWTASIYKNPYDGSEQRISHTGDVGSRSLRGGSWGNYADWLRSGNRLYNSPSLRNLNIGFRLARVPLRQDR